MPKVTTQAKTGFSRAWSIQNVVMFLTLLAIATLSARIYAGTDLPGSDRLARIFGLNVQPLDLGGGSG